MGAPYRESAEPYREPKPDGLEEMRRERAAAAARRLKFVGPPFGIAFIAVALFLAGQTVMSSYDGFPFALWPGLIVIALSLLSVVVMWLFWKGLPRIVSVILIAASLAIAGAWIHRDTSARHATRHHLAEGWCDKDRREEGQTLEACVGRVAHCIAVQDLPLLVKRDPVIWLGHPCDVMIYAQQ